MFRRTIINSSLNIFEQATTVTLNNATGFIYSYRITSNLCFCVMEITPTSLENNSLLAWGLWSPACQLMLSLPTVGGGNVPCILTTNGELRVYYSPYTTLERIDFCFMYPYKRN